MQRKDSPLVVAAVVTAQPEFIDSISGSTSENCVGLAPSLDSRSWKMSGSLTPSFNRGFSLGATAMAPLKSQRQAESERAQADALCIAEGLDMDGDGFLKLHGVRSTIEIEKGDTEDWFRQIDVKGTRAITAAQFVKGYCAPAPSPPILSPAARFRQAGIAIVKETRLTRFLDRFSLVGSCRSYLEKAQLDRAMKMFQVIDADGSGALIIGQVKTAAPKLSLSVAKAVRWFVYF
jgi:hypothetical protein